MTIDAGAIEYRIDVETAGVINSTNSVDKEMGKLQKTMDSTDASATALGGGFSKLASAIAGVMTVAAVAAEFQKAINVTMQFNATISNLSALTGAVGKDLETFRQAAIDIGGSTSLSASQAAEAMKLIGSASPDLLKSADSLKAVTREAVVLAEAAGVSLPQAATALTATLNQFQLGADQASRVINVLAAGAKEGSSEIEQTVQVLQNAGVVAAQAGVSFEQFNGAVQALAQGEIKGAEAGTGLRNILLILNNAADKQLRPSVVGLSKAIENLEKAQAGGLDMLKLFGRENITAASTLVQFRGTMDSVTTAVTGTSEAYRQASVNQDNLKGDVAQLSSAFETLQLAVGDLSDSTLRSLTQNLTELLGQIGNNKDAIASFFSVAGTAAAAFATIITARVISSVYGFTAATVANTAAQLTNRGAVTGVSAALGVQAAALTRGAVVMNAATIAGTALSRVMALLGGPVGVVALAGFAIYELGGRVSEYVSTGGRGVATSNNLAASMDTLSTAAQRASNRFKELIGDVSKLNKQEVTIRTGEVEKALAKSEADLKRYTRLFESGNTSVNIGLIDQTKANITLLNEELAKLKKNNTATTDDPNVTEEGQKAIGVLEKRLALEKTIGVERAKLAALQGAENASDPEKKRIEELSAGIFKLEEQRRKLNETEKAGAKVDDSTQKKIDALRLEAETLGKTAREEELYRLAKSGATEEQIKAADASLTAIETYNKEREALAALASEEERRRAKFGTTTADATAEVTGAVPPLTGGPFDEQTARYEAEAQAEDQRYADQLARLQEAKALQIEVVGGYQAVEEQMAQQHADRMNQIEQARNQVMLNSAGSAFGQMSDDIMAFAQVFGNENSKMLAIAKAAAITQTIISTYEGAQKAYTSLAGIPIVGPALGVAAAGAAIAGGMARVAAIKSQGGRAQGGPVQSNGMYRVNETGKPEIFNAANGRQYMMPNSRGEVVSNKDATSSGGSSTAPVVNVHNYSGQQASTTSKFSDADRAWVIDVVVGDGMGDGKTGRMINSLTGTKRQGS